MIKQGPRPAAARAPDPQRVPRPVAAALADPFVIPGLGNIFDEEEEEGEGEEEEEEGRRPGAPEPAAGAAVRLEAADEYEWDGGRGVMADLQRQLNRPVPAASPRDFMFLSVGPRTGATAASPGNRILAGNFDLMSREVTTAAAIAFSRHKEDDNTKRIGYVV